MIRALYDASLLAGYAVACWSLKQIEGGLGAIRRRLDRRPATEADAGPAPSDTGGGSSKGRATRTKRRADKRRSSNPTDPLDL
jgi:hypothetical protein